MRLQVQKQVTEPVEITTPCYFKDDTGIHFINEAGTITTVRRAMISVWSTEDIFYKSTLKEVVNGQQVESREFESALLLAREVIHTALTV